MALTKRAIDRLAWDPSGPDTQIIYDPNGVPGFGVRLRPSGRKTFVVWLRTKAGRKRLVTIGTYGVLTLDQARERAQRALVDALDGADVIADRHAIRSATTIREYRDVYLDRHAKPHKKSWKEDERRLDKYIVPKLGGHRLAEVTRADVSKLHHAIGVRRPYEANRVLALLSTMYTKADAWGLVSEGHPKPTRGITMFHEHERDRWVEPADMPRLWNAIAEEPNIYIRAVTWLYLLTGARRNELLPRRWDEISEDRRELRLPMTKDGEPHRIPLSSAAWSLLLDIPRTAGNAHIFCGKRRGSHLVNVGPAWRRIRARAGLDDVRIHDLRRTVGSWLANSGASLQLIGAVLNHSNIDTTRIYARLQNDAARDALEAHGQRILDIARAGV